MKALCPFRSIPRFLRAMLLLPLLVVLPASLAPAPSVAADDPLEAGRALMRAGDYRGAAAAFDASLESGGEEADAALYLRSLSLFKVGDHEAAAAEAGKVASRFPASPWLRKALFLEAAAFTAMHRYREAEEIYRREAHRLLSGERKRGIASAVVALADEMSAAAEAGDLQAPPPDFGKAYTLYGKVLEMEIDRDLRDEVTFKHARVIGQAGNPGKAVEDFHAYLEMFDPDWIGASGSPESRRRMKRGNPPPPGAHRLEARLLMARALLDANRRPQARREAEDLLALLAAQEDSPAGLKADSAWLVVRSYGLPQVDASRLDLAVASVRDFLAAHPSDRRSIGAAFLIAESFRTAGRADEAIEAYRDFIAGKGYALPAGEEATRIDGESGTSPAALREEYAQRALFQVGNILFSQGKFDEAAGNWAEYVRRFPDGPDWAAAQEGIINAEFQKGILALQEGRTEEGRTLLEAFLRAHPLDGRTRRTMFIFGQLHHVEAEEAERGGGRGDVPAALYRRAVEEWSRLISKYPRSEESSLALYRTGVVYEEKLDDLEKALDSYRRLDWGSRSSRARQRIGALTGKELKISTERIFRTNEPAAITLRTRNIKKVTVRQYFLDLREYFRKTHDIADIGSLDIDLIEPDRSWEVEIDGFRAYAPKEQLVEIPFDADAPGVCIIQVSEEDWESTTLVIRSDIDLIFKSSRREVLVFVEDRLAGAPAEGVELLVSDGTSVVATGRSGSDGVFRKRLEALQDLSRVRVFASRAGHAAAFNLDIGGLGIGTGLTPRGYLYPSRPAYRPGEKVSIRGIIRDVEKGQYSPPAGKPFTVSLTDTQGRLLREETILLSEFGTFETSFDLPGGAPLGRYVVTALHKRPGGADLRFAGGFLVQEFKLETLRLEMTFPRQVYFRGETVEAEIRAAYYWGEPAAGRQVRYELPDGRSYRGETGVDGTLKLSFDTTTMVPGTALAFRATLEGENVTVGRTVALARLGYRLEVKPSQEVVLAGEPFEVKVKTTGADGRPVGREVNLRVIRRPDPAPDPLFAGLPWQSAVVRTADVTAAEEKVSTDPLTGEAVLPLTIADGGRYLLRVAGEDRFGQTVSGDGSLTVSGDEDEVKLRFFAPTDRLEVGGRAALRLHSRLDSGLALVTFEGEEILGYRIVPLSRGFNDLSFPVEHGHFPNFRSAAAVMDDRTLRTATRDFTVARKLHVEVRPRQEAFHPGEEGTVELTVTDQLGAPVRAELSLSLVDEALYAVHRDDTPPIIDFFQADARRHAEFRAGSSCGFRYDGVTENVAEEVLAEKERLRSQAEEAAAMDAFRDASQQFMAADALEPMPATAPPVMEQKAKRRMEFGKTVSGEYLERDEEKREDFDGQRLLALRGEDIPVSPPVDEPRREIPGRGFWIPSIVTDDEGLATVRIPMPEKATRWRLTSRGCTVETLVGEAVASVLTRKDFFVEIKAPDLLQEKDDVRVLARLHNLTGYAGPVTLSLTVRGLGEKSRILADLKKEIEVEGGAGAEVVFSGIEVPAVTAVDIELRAVGGQHSDSLALEVPVRPWGLEFAAHRGGVSTADVTAHLRLPEGQNYTSRSMTFSVGPSLVRSVVDLALGIRPVPLPVGESAAGLIAVPPVPGSFSGSDLLAAVSGLDYARAAKAPALEISRLTERARSLASGLVVSQRSDGSWGWRPGSSRSSSDWAPTSLAYRALVRAAAIGIAVDRRVLTQASSYLQNRFKSFHTGDNEAKAAVLHALSATGAADFANLNRLYRERNSLRSGTLARLALAFLNLKRDEFAGEILTLLENSAQSATSGKHEFASWSHRGSHPWLRDEVETTALVLQAFSRGRPRSPVAAEAAAFLLDRKGCYGIAPAKARGNVVAALAMHFSQGIQADSDYRIEVFVNGIGTARIEASGPRRTHFFTVPAFLLTDGMNRVEFKMRGRGEFAWAVTLGGFSPDMNDPRSWDRPYPHRRHYYHSRLEYRGRPIDAAGTSSVENLEAGQRVDVRVEFSNPSRGNSFHGYGVVEEHLPSGTTLVEGSLRGGFVDYEIGRSKITLFYPEGTRPGSFSYQLIGYSPGTFPALPTVMRDALKPGRLRLGPLSEITVLAPGEKSPDQYRMNTDELFILGTLHFEDGRYDRALALLGEHYRLHPTYRQREVGQMLLWIRTAEGFYDSRQIVELFEILREHHPDLEIPFDKILVVGRAYRDIGEHERAGLVFKAAIAGSFVSDAGVSALLEDEGRFFASLDYQEGIWREYPDTADVVAAFFALPQALFQKAPQAGGMPKEGERVPNRLEMLTETVRLLEEFLTLYPGDPLADDAAFSLCNAFLELKNFPLTVRLSRLFIGRYPESALADSFRYMAALGLFRQGKHDEAIAAARTVAEGEGKDRDFARYIAGQIHHAEGEPEKAIEWYRKVREIYPDAGESIAYFEEKRISLDESTVVRPGEKAGVTLRYRNIREALFQVYRVDLMKLYLREKNLSEITKVKLAGIEPETELTRILGDGKDYVEKETVVHLPLEEEGAYLVICRGDDLFASGLVLITPMKIEVQADAVSGRVRANVLDAVAGGYRADVHVKAIGSADTDFQSGETDLRGIFTADGLRGKATVIAREGEARYAFYRGEKWLGAPPERPASSVLPRKTPAQMDYRQNLRMNQQLIQEQNFQQFDQLRRTKQKGVQVKSAF